MGWVGARQDSAGPHPVPGLQPVPWVSGLARHSKVPLHTPQLDQHRGTCLHTEAASGDHGVLTPASPQAGKYKKASDFAAQLCQNPALLASTLGQGLTVGQVLHVD